MADFGNEARKITTAQLAYKGGWNVETLAAARVLTNKDSNFQKLDPGGAARDVTLPAISSSEGTFFHIVNAADAAENLVVKNPAGSTIGTINQNEEGIFFCDGSAWVLFRIATIALA